MRGLWRTYSAFNKTNQNQAAQKGVQTMDQIRKRIAEKKAAKQQRQELDPYFGMDKLVRAAHEEIKEEEKLTQTHRITLFGPIKNDAYKKLMQELPPSPS